MRHAIRILLATATCGFLIPAAAANANPMDWPADTASDAEHAQHCAAVLTSFGMAYLYAAELMEMEQVPRPEMLPAHLLEAAGGPDSYPTIISMVADWRENWQSMGRTNFYPRLAGDGTPYVADDGQILMHAVDRCMQHYEL